MASRNLAPDISILMVSWNTCALTEARLDSILGCKLTPAELTCVPLDIGSSGCFAETEA